MAGARFCLQVQAVLTRGKSANQAVPAGLRWHIFPWIGLAEALAGCAFSSVFSSSKCSREGKRFLVALKELVWRWKGRLESPGPSHAWRFGWDGV